MALVFPFYGNARRMDYVQRWSQQLLRVLAIRLTAAGVPPRRHAVPVIIVANHVSWLDIFAVNAVRTVRFVAKAEIRRWPVFGWLCGQGSALFIERARRNHASHINQQMEAALRQGDMFVVFPEGLTSSGNVLLPFYASLLQPAPACNALLYPVAIRYTRTDGSLCDEADYAGDKSMLDSLLLMLTQPVIHARLEFLAPLESAGKHRRELAHEAAQLIAGALGVPAPRRRGGTASGQKV